MVTLTVEESMNILKKNGIPTVRQFKVKSIFDLASACKKTGFPAAMKIVSKSISHKTDKGGVLLNIHSILEAKKAFNKLKKLRGFESVLVQKQLRGTEVIVGGKLDEQFGPTILFGIGGIFVETFEDVSVRICPITSRDADKMIKEIKGYTILQGTRGQKPANIKKLKQILLKTSNLMQKNKIKELDINPLIINEKDAIAVDARIIS